ncbi:MAG: hypothetical protein HC847_01130 [Hydrococcus sp. RU_2_2]|nr:hypothetical protein [Hydrococcus sp. RU_2_2]NJP17666.1 hypothetical protein [Hydrococcus sp. CRU_1_1]
MQLERAARSGNGTLKWFPSTVIKDLEIDDNIIESAIASQSLFANGKWRCLLHPRLYLSLGDGANCYGATAANAVFLSSVRTLLRYDREPQLETLRRRLQRNGNPIDFPALSAPFSRPYQPYPRQNGWQELR